MLVSISVLVLVLVLTLSVGVSHVSVGISISKTIVGSDCCACCKCSYYLDAHKFNTNYYSCSALLSFVAVPLL